MLRWMVCFFSVTLLLSMLLQPGLAQQPASTDISGATVKASFLLGVQKGWRTPAADLNCDYQGDALDIFTLAGKWYAYHQCQCVHDADHDGLTNCEEFILGTDPSNRDTDQDCLADGLEFVLGLDPLNPDTNGNGTPDGEDDFDGNGIPDGDEDFDLDNIPNCEETWSYCCDPTDPDTDGDGWPDGAEVDADTDPCDSLSQPWAIYSSAMVRVFLPSVDESVRSVVQANPHVRVYKPSVDPALSNTVQAKPHVRVYKPSVDPDLRNVVQAAPLRVIKPDISRPYRNTMVAAPGVVVSTTGE